MRRRGEKRVGASRDEKVVGSHGGSNPKLDRSSQYLPKPSSSCVRGGANSLKLGYKNRHGGSHHQASDSGSLALSL